MKEKSKEKIDERNNLKLTRFCGEELYPIKTATWHFYENKDEKTNEIWLKIETDLGIQLSDDTKELAATPDWELTIRAKNLSLNDLKIGLRAAIKQGYDDDLEESLTNFYYCEHEQTDNNKIEILDKKGTKILFKIIGEVPDINYYDGSKPKNTIYVEAWFYKE